MTEEQLYIALDSGRISKFQIDGLVLQLEEHPKLAPALFRLVLMEDKEETFSASWTFDHLMRKQLVFLIPIIDEFTNGLAELKSESCIRPIAHVCEMVCEAYFRKKHPLFVKKCKG